MSTDTRTEPEYYLTAPTMAYARSRVLRISADGAVALHDQGQWRDLKHSTSVPDDARAITTRTAVARIGHTT